MTLLLCHAFFVQKSYGSDQCSTYEYCDGEALLSIGAAVYDAGLPVKLYIVIITISHFSRFAHLTPGHAQQQLRCIHCI